MNKYLYNGLYEIDLPGFGTVKPGEVVEVSFAINHPHFESVDPRPVKSKKN